MSQALLLTVKPCMRLSSLLKALDSENDSRMKVDRVLANHSLSSTAYQGTTNIPFPSLSLKRASDDLGCRQHKSSDSLFFSNPPVVALVIVILILLPVDPEVELVLLFLSTSLKIVNP